MAVHVRLIEPGEVAAFARSVAIPFLEGEADPERVAVFEDCLEPGRAWAAVDGDRFVGNACVYSREVSLPGPPGRPCPSLPFAAVSAVGVHPTHRRRGLLNSLMDAMLHDAVARGEAAAGLMASESIIYGRYGYGLATRAAEYVVDTRHSAFARPVPAVEVALLEPAEAAKAVPPVVERVRALRPGEVNLTDKVWKDIFADRRSTRRGASAWFYAVTDGGCAMYRVEAVGDGGEEWGRVKLRGLCGETPEIEAALWRFVLDLDLVREVVARPFSPADPLVHRFADPRQLRTRAIDDFLWLRVLDVPAAFEARGYRVAGRVVLDVSPAPTPPSGGDPAAGRWVLDAGPDGASCRPATAGAGTDLRCGAGVLGSLLAGGERPSVLAAAGLISEERPGALDLADRLFASRPAPYCSVGF